MVPYMGHKQPLLILSGRKKKMKQDGEKETSIAPLESRGKWKSWTLLCTVTNLDRKVNNMKHGGRT